MDAEIEHLVKTCPVCQESRPTPAPAPLHPWEYPSQPWSRLHLDFAGPFKGSMFLIIVDAYSKWIDVHIMQSITTSKTIEKLRITFTNQGLPRKVVTDNGASFTSEEFKTFMSQNGIVHVTSAPYHPSSNGLAERAVQTVKNGLKRTPGKTLQEKLSKFLFTYRIITPQTTTGIAPAQLLTGRRLRSRLDRLFPDHTVRVQDQQLKQAQQHDTSKPLRTFKVGDTVYVRDFSTPSSTWIPGEVTKVTGPLSYHVQLESGQVVRRHVDAVRKRESRSPPLPHVQSEADDEENDLYLPSMPPAPPSLPTVDVSPLAPGASLGRGTTLPVPQPLPPPLPTPPPPPTMTRRSTRQTGPPNRFGWTS